MWPRMFLGITHAMVVTSDARSSSSVVATETSFHQCLFVRVLSIVDTLAQNEHTYVQYLGWWKEATCLQQSGLG